MFEEQWQPFGKPIVLRDGEKVFWIEDDKKGYMIIPDPGTEFPAFECFCASNNAGMTVYPATVTIRVI